MVSSDIIVGQWESFNGSCFRRMPSAGYVRLIKIISKCYCSVHIILPGFKGASFLRQFVIYHVLCLLLAQVSFQ